MSILASLVVSLTVTPVLAYWLLPPARIVARPRDSLLLRGSNGWRAGPFGSASGIPGRCWGWCVAAVVASGLTVLRLGRDFLPPFNEGSVQINVVLPPGNSLETSQRIAAMIEQRLQHVRGVLDFGRRTGRAELDEHAEGVNMSEIIVTLDPRVGPQPRGDPGGTARGIGPSPRAPRSPWSSRCST